MTYITAILLGTFTDMNNDISELNLDDLAEVNGGIGAAKEPEPLLSLFYSLNPYARVTFSKPASI